MRVTPGASSRGPRGELWDCERSARPGAGRLVHCPSIVVLPAVWAAVRPEGLQSIYRRMPGEVWRGDCLRLGAIEPVMASAIKDSNDAPPADYRLDPRGRGY